ncbi:macrosialin [Anolis carolinensis]|uniref:macrosialin n=1 Tax=Anolis carolinensis TaxID=28377 RepID=UPI002F2B44A8
MQAPRKAPWALLCLAGWALLAAGCASATEHGPLCLDDVALEDPGCPHRRKAATLLPSFTETPSTTMMPTTATTHHNVTNHTATPTHHTTLHSHSNTTTAGPQKHTTSHHHHRRATTTAHHTTTDHHPRPTTSTHHTTTTRHHNGTTSHQPHPTPSPHHTTTRQHNLTTAHHHSFTTTHQPHPNTTVHHHNFTTTHRPHPNTTAHPLPTTGHSPTNHTTAVLTTPAHHSSPPPPVPPTVVPFVLVGDYHVKGNDSEVCLRAQMGLQLRIRYTKKGQEQAWGEFSLQPNRTNATGTCNKTSSLRLDFPEGFVSFFFAKNDSQNTYYLSRVQARLTYRFPQAAESSFGADNASLHEFQSHLGHSYQCRNRSLVLKEGFQLNILRERIQAFGLPKGEFGEAEVCPEQRRSSALPIVVGVVLGLLILIVVVAFLFGRWRKRPGYQTL